MWRSEVNWTSQFAEIPFGNRAVPERRTISVPFKLNNPFFTKRQTFSDGWDNIWDNETMDGTVFLKNPLEIVGYLQRCFAESRKPHLNEPFVSLTPKARRSRSEVKWIRQFPENLFGNCGGPPEVFRRLEYQKFIVPMEESFYLPSLFENHTVLFLLNVACYPTTATASTCFVEKKYSARL